MTWSDSRPDAPAAEATAAPPWRLTLLLVVAAGLAAGQTPPAPTPGPTPLPTLEAAIEQARSLARRHRFAEVVDLLEPFASGQLDDEAEYALAAEVGRALFHLGRYREADARFQRAVRLHPERVETALYLEATSYLTGDRERALAIFRAIVTSGARDLFLAVTLPGERAFLAEPEVWRTLDAHAVPLQIDLETGGLLGLRLGEARSSAVAILGHGAPEEATQPVISARAGPHLLWAFRFAGDALDEIVVDVASVVRYTPYRPRLGDDLDWRSTRTEVEASLGPPRAVRSTADGTVVTWTVGELELRLAFGPPFAPRSPAIADGVDMLRLVTMHRADL